MHSSAPLHLSICQRLLHEVGDLIQLTGYFYVAFVALAFYKATVLHSYGIHYVVWGAALIKAFLMAKFLMMGRPMKIGARSGHAPLVKSILYKSLFLLALLVVLTALEQTLTGLFHHHSLSAVLGELAANSGEKLAEVLILLLVLLPFVAFDSLGDALGKGRLQAMLFRSLPG